MSGCVEDFYDHLSSLYHLIYQDWELSIDRQGKQLSHLIRERWGWDAKSILDVSCGIGTQCLGLAAQGFAVTGSDLSCSSIKRAKQEAKSRGLEIAFSNCDMRHIGVHHSCDFDVVLSADNSIPHLLSDEEILLVLKSMYSRIRPGGGCIITLRDYDQIERGQQVIQPYGIRQTGDTRYLIWQVWDFDGDQYDLSMYFVEDDLRTSKAKTHVMRSRYYAVSPKSVLALMQEAGFIHVERLDGVFFQPVLVGTRSA